MIDVSKLQAIQSGLSLGAQNDTPQWSTGGVTFTRNPQTGEWENPTSDDPELQQWIKQGLISSTGVDFSKLPKTAYGTAFGELGGAGYRQVQVDANGQIVDPSGNWRISNPAAVRNDPNYGWITPQQNISNKDDWYDVLSGTVLPAAIAAVATAGATSIGAGVPWYASAGMKALQGGLNNPLSILSALAPGLNDLGVPAGLTSAAQFGLTGAGIYNAYNAYTDQNQKQYSTSVPGAATSAQTATPFAPSLAANVAGGVLAPTAPIAPAANVPAPSVQYLPDPESGIPDQYNAAAFGGGGSSQVITDQGSAPVATAIAPDAYRNSNSQIVS